MFSESFINNQMNEFSSLKIPPFTIGEGSFKEIYCWLKGNSFKNLILVTSKSFIKKNHYSLLLRFLEENNIFHELIICKEEPSSDFIDKQIFKFHKFNIDSIIAIGGGSVIDLGKAISAMIPLGESILKYIDNSNNLIHPGNKIPYLVIPTTSGTGGEVTRNAVVTNIGPKGFKRSIRHDNFIPDHVIIDGELLKSAPTNISAACGLDALTQLIEAYISNHSSPLTDAISWSGLQYFFDNFFLACTSGSNNVKVRQSLAYSALCSGIALANADLGIVHGIAVPLGGFFNIPHGEACARLLSASLKVNFDALKKRDSNNPSLIKLLNINNLICRKDMNNPNYNDINSLTNLIDKWINELNIPTLGIYNITKKDIPKILEATSLRNNPIALTKSEIKKIIELSL